MGGLLVPSSMQRIRSFLTERCGMKVKPWASTEDIMDSCNVDKAKQEAVLTCLRRLRDSWTTGIAETLAGAPCTDVDIDLGCFAYMSQTCMMNSSDDEFVVGSTEICRPIPIYLGVRFV
jgi:hypothetical protein